MISVTVTLAEEGEQPNVIDRRTFDLPEVTVGSAPGCTLRLAHARVEHLHARFSRGLDGYALVDEGSVEGTFVAGSRLRRSERRPIRGGDVVRLGPFHLEIAVGPQPAVRASGGTVSLAIALVEDEVRKAGGSSAPRVEVCAGPDRRKRLDLVGRKDYLLGRDRSADLPLAEPKASRHHVRVGLRDSAVWVQDLGSSNGTHLGGARLPPNEPVRWRAGVELRIGDDVLVHRDPSVEALAELDRKAVEALGGRPSLHEVEHIGAPPDFRPSQPTLTDLRAAPSVSEIAFEEHSVEQTASALPTQAPASTVLASQQAPITALPREDDEPSGRGVQGEGGRAERRRWGAIEVLLVVTVTFAFVCLSAMIWMLFA